MSADPVGSLSAEALAAAHLERRLSTLTVIERVCSVLSLLGCVFTIVTFCSSKAFHKPINRLVFYATFGNMMTNVGTLMSRTYISTPDSFGCQFQSFLIQMFMPADSLWILAMAINVHLTFYQKFDARRLRKMELPYFICCYGIPFIPALTYIFVRNSEGHRVFGDATLWCWITPEWDTLRIASFYGPVWLVISLTMAIYIRAGRTIYEKRKQLNDFSGTETEPNAFSVKTTEVLVVSEVVENAGDRTSRYLVQPVQQPPQQDQQGQGQPAIGNLVPLVPLPRSSDVPATNGVTSQAPAGGAYSVTISTDQRAISPDEDVEARREPHVHSSSSNPRQQRRRMYEANNAAWSYTKCAILFFTAILITWIPSSANRVYSVVHGGEVLAPLEYMSAFVLPLQGFWNSIIYIMTSWSACKIYFRDLWRGHQAKPDVREMGFTGRESYIPHTVSSGKSFETESTTELSVSTRPGTNEVR